MGNFLGDLGAAIRGHQDYQKYLKDQEGADLLNQQRAAQLAEIKDLTAQKQADRARLGDVGRYTLDYLAQNNPQGIAPPPQQTPMPGQQSMPMQQPTTKYGPVSLGQDMGMPPQGMPPPPMGMPSQDLPPDQSPLVPQTPMGPDSGPPMPPGGPLTAQQGTPAIPPYQTVQGASNGPAGFFPPADGIPQPPQAVQTIGPPPAPDSMTIQDAARFIKAQGITDPITGMQVLDKLTPFLNDDAKNQAATLKMQQIHDDKKEALEERKRQTDAMLEDKRLTREQRDALERDRMETNRTLRMMQIGINQQMANAQTTKGKPGSGGGLSGYQDAKGNILPGVEGAAWDKLINGKTPPAKSGMYGPMMEFVEKIARDNNMSPQDIMSASADVKTRLMAKAKFEVRAQNMERAENQIMAEIPLIRENMKGLNMFSIPLFQKGGLAALRAAGDPRVTKFDQSLETVFNEFEGIKTGNPGTLNVSDVTNAKKNIDHATTERELNAALDGMERIMNNAKGALEKTRSSTMTEANKLFAKKEAAKPVFSSLKELQDAVKAKKIKPGEKFNDPNGNEHTVN